MMLQNRKLFWLMILIFFHILNIVVVDSKNITLGKLVILTQIKFSLNFSSIVLTYALECSSQVSWSITDGEI